MKKSLIALAAVAASGAAMAQSSVTLYGVVDTSVGYVKGEESVSGLLNSGNATSRLGFRGVEDLGNGLKAEFVLEGEVQPDDGTAGGFNFKRQSTVGLAGEFGQVRLGRALTASYNAVSRYDVFGTVGLGASRMWNGDAFAADINDTIGGVDVKGSVNFGAYQNRANNMVSYISPSFAGFKFGVDYGFGEQEKNRDGRYWGFGATYDNGPLSLGLGYDRMNNLASTVKGVDAVTGDTAAYESQADVKTWHLGGSYDFGVAKIAAAYKQQTNEVNEEFVANGVVAGSDAFKFKFKSYMLGVSAPVGAAGVVKASFNNYKLSDGAGKANQFALGYVHNLSKRTAVYGTYAYLKNKDGAGFTLGGGAFSAAGLKDGEKQQGIQVGVRHAF